MHNYTETNEFGTFMCKVCRIIKSTWYNPTTKQDETNYFYQRPKPIYGWVELSDELTCNELIIKNIIE